MTSAILPDRLGAHHEPFRGLCGPSVAISQYTREREWRQGSHARPVPARGFNSEVGHSGGKKRGDILSGHVESTLPSVVRRARGWGRRLTAGGSGGGGGDTRAAVSLWSFGAVAPTSACHSGESVPCSSAIGSSRSINEGVHGSQGFGFGFTDGGGEADRHFPMCIIVHIP